MNMMDESLSGEVVTVLVVTYNQEAYIEHTLDSILNQETEFDFRIVVSDDCSQDRTEDICKSYVALYPDLITYVRRSTNLKAVKNIIYSLVDNMDCNYFALCAGDDIWVDKKKLQKQYDAINNSKDVSVVLTGYRKCFENENRVEDIVEWESPLLRRYGNKMIKYVLLEKFSFFPVGSSLFFRTNAIKDLINYADLYNNPNAPGEAMILFPLFARYGRYCFISDVTVAYRIREGSLSHHESVQKKTEFSIKYAFQKINAAQAFNQSYGLKLKLTIKLILLYFYATKENGESIFVDVIESLSKKERSKYIKTANRMVLFLDNHRRMRKLLLYFFNIVR